MVENNTTTIATKKNSTETSLDPLWVVGQYSYTLVLDKRFCIDYDFNSPSNIIVEKRKEGLLIRKVGGLR